MEVELSYQLSKRSKTLQMGGVGKILVGGGDGGVGRRWGHQGDWQVQQMGSVGGVGRGVALFRCLLQNWILVIGVPLRPCLVLSVDATLPADGAGHLHTSPRTPAREL